MAAGIDTSQWFLEATGGTRVGPFTRQQLEILRKEGKITDRQRVISANSNQWITIAQFFAPGSVQEVTKSFSPPPRPDLERAKNNLGPHPSEGASKIFSVASLYDTLQDAKERKPRAEPPPPPPLIEASQEASGHTRHRAVLIILLLAALGGGAWLLLGKIQSSSLKAGKQAPLAVSSPTPLQTPFQPGHTERPHVAVPPPPAFDRLARHTPTAIPTTEPPRPVPEETPDLRNEEAKEPPFHPGDTSLPPVHNEPPADAANPENLPQNQDRFDNTDRKGGRRNRQNRPEEIPQVQPFQGEEPQQVAPAPPQFE